MNNSRFSIPENLNLVVNDYIPPYEFSDGGNMVRINGSGLISGYGPDGFVGAVEVSQVGFSGEFEIDIDIRENQSQAFQFIGVVFSGELDIRCSSLETIHFANCDFDEGTIIRMSGAAEGVSFLGCSFGKGVSVDIRNLELDCDVVATDCVGEEDSGFLLPEKTVPQETNWKLPAAALAAVGVISVISRRAQANKQKKLNRSIQEIEASYEQK